MYLGSTKLRVKHKEKVFLFSPPKSTARRGRDCPVGAGAGAGWGWGATLQFPAAAHGAPSGEATRFVTLARSLSGSLFPALLGARPLTHFFGCEGSLSKIVYGKRSLFATLARLAYFCSHLFFYPFVWLICFCVFLIFSPA